MESMIKETLFEKIDELSEQIENSSDDSTTAHEDVIRLIYDAAEEASYRLQLPDGYKAVAEGEVYELQLVPDEDYEGEFIEASRDDIREFEAKLSAVWLATAFEYLCFYRATH